MRVIGIPQEILGGLVRARVMPVVGVIVTGDEPGRLDRDQSAEHEVFAS